MKGRSGVWRSKGRDGPGDGGWSCQDGNGVHRCPDYTLSHSGRERTTSSQEKTIAKRTLRGVEKSGCGVGEDGFPRLWRFGRTLGMTTVHSEVPRGKDPRKS